MLWPDLVILKERNGILTQELRHILFPTDHYLQQFERSTSPSTVLVEAQLYGVAEMYKSYLATEVITSTSNSETLHGSPKAAILSPFHESTTATAVSSSLREKPDGTRKRVISSVSGSDTARRRGHYMKSTPNYLTRATRTRLTPLRNLKPAHGRSGTVHLDTSASKH